MESKTLTKDMALRMELGLEIEERINKRFAEKTEQISKSNQELEQKVADLLAGKAKLSAETILESEHLSITQDLTKKVSSLDTELAGLKKKYDTLREQSATIKSEHAEFKRLDPQGLKKKLDENKKKLKLKTQTVSDMTKDKVKLNDTVASLKREIENLKKAAEATEAE